MREQSEIDGTLLNPVSLTDLIKGETKATTKKGWLHSLEAVEIVFLLCFYL